MLKSRYHAFFLGKTPWGLLHAFGLRKKGQDVLVVDDLNISTTSCAYRWLSHFEVQQLQLLGQKIDHPAMSELSSYLTPARVKVFTPKHQWVSGPSARDNLREFVRKFEVFQTETLLKAIESDQLDFDLTQMAKTFIPWFQSFEVRKKPSAPFTYPQCAWLQEFQKILVSELNRPYQSEKSHELPQLVMAFFAATSQTIKYNFTQHEAAFIALKLLSPLYELDIRWMERELIRSLEAVGGHYKEASIQSWQFWQEQVEAALLDSYEGVISFDRLLLYGTPKAHAEVECHFKEKIYRGLETSWSHAQHELVTMNRSELITMTAPHLIGTDVPVMILEDQPRATTLNVLVEDKPGALPQFYRLEAMELAHPFLNHNMPQIMPHFTKFQPQTGWDIWLEETQLNERVGQQLYLHESRDVKVYRRDKQTLLKDFEYWGPMMNKRFGNLGFLTEILWDLT